MTTQVVTAPLYLPVTLAEVRAWLRIDAPTDAAELATENGVLRRLIGAMVRHAENLTHRAYVERTLRLTLPCWPWIENEHYCGPGIELPYPKALEVTGIVYIDDEGDQQTLAADQYTLHDFREPGFIVPAWVDGSPVIWPLLRGVPNAVQVTWKAGFPPVGSPQDEAAHQAGQPDTLKHWIEARVATLWENREKLVVGAGGNVIELPRSHADGILDELVVGTRIA